MIASFRQLQIFAAVARHLSYTRAAEELNLTQPAVFTQVRQIQDQVGTPLIERIGKRLYLTEAGRVVLATAREILGEMERLDMRLAELNGMVRGRLRVAVVSTAKYDIPRRLGEFCRVHPGIDVALTVGNREELLTRFAANEDDLYVLGTPPQEADAEHHVYAENPIVVIAPPGHPLAGRGPLSPAVLAEEPFLMREKGSGTRIATERFFAEQGLAPPVRMELGANEAIKQAVMAGLGLSVLSRGSARLELDNGHLTELAVEGFPLLRHWHVAWPRGKRLSVGARAFLDVLFDGRAPKPAA
ncbi:MAG: LysR family transcriptional regulator [Rhodobacteraceae bacterium]|nr:LysR family transcriptional regulator [Paracoccaceae bacterium]